MSWLEQGWQHVWLPYAQMQTAKLPLPVARTQGARIILEDGQELIDGIASWWTACHGYNHPHIHAAMAKQLATLPHVMFGGLAHEPAYSLAARLAKLMPGDLNRVFFTDSGSVAVEVALKIAVQSWINQGVHGRTKILAFMGGYHGDTLGTMAICDPEEGMHSLFTGLLPTQPVIPLPQDPASIAAFEEFLEREHRSLAAIIVEPLVQGAGGMVFHTPDTLKRLRMAADAYGLPLIFDEIFTGFGRTGTMFAFEQAGVVPDIITLSKALTGGSSPLAATIATDRLFKLFLSESPTTALMHGPTFMAHALGCAAANASLDLFETEPRLAQVDAISNQLKHELTPCQNLPGVKDVRVMGAIGVVQLENLNNPTALRQQLISKGVWVRPFRDILYLTPAFTISPDDLSCLTSAIYKTLIQSDSSPMR